MGNRFKFFILACLALSAVSIFYILRAGEGVKKEEVVKYPLPEAAADPEKGKTVTSPDGKWALTLKTEKGKEGKTFRFLITGPEVSGKEVYARTLAEGDITIPANTFSPDDKYFFLKEETPAGTGYPVFTVSGDPVAKEGQSQDFAVLFAAKHENYKISEATGWGGVNLIVFNTDKVEGGIGPSFWYEVPSGAFIQLSNRFN